MENHVESDLLSVRTNTAAMKAATAVTMVQRSIETSMERLSTGKRLNSAADDAAGVAIASRLNASLRGTNQSIRNALDTQALVDTAEGAMQETEALLQRIRELAVQAASDTNSSTDRAALDAEKNQLLAEIDRIASTTSWAGQNLLDGTFTEKSFHVGGGTMAADILSTSIGAMSATGLGLTSSTTTTSTTVFKKVGTNVLQVTGTPTAGDVFHFTIGGVDMAVKVDDIEADLSVTDVATASNGSSVKFNGTDLLTLTATGAGGSDEVNFTINGITLQVSFTAGNTAAQNAAILKSAIDASQLKINAIDNSDGTLTIFEQTAYSVSTDGGSTFTSQTAVNKNGVEGVAEAIKTEINDLTATKFVGLSAISTSDGAVTLSQNITFSSASETNQSTAASINSNGDVLTIDASGVAVGGTTTFDINGETIAVTLTTGDAYAENINGLKILLENAIANNTKLGGLDLAVEISGTDIIISATAKTTNLIQDISIERAVLTTNEASGSTSATSEITTIQPTVLATENPNIAPVATFLLDNGNMFVETENYSSGTPVTFHIFDSEGTLLKQIQPTNRYANTYYHENLLYVQQGTTANYDIYDESGNLTAIGTLPFALNNLSWDDIYGGTVRYPRSDFWEGATNYIFQTDINDQVTEVYKDEVGVFNQNGNFASFAVYREIKFARTSETFNLTIDSQGLGDITDVKVTNLGENILIYLLFIDPATGEANLLFQDYDTSYNALNQPQTLYSGFRHNINGYNPLAVDILTLNSDEFVVTYSGDIDQVWDDWQSEVFVAHVKMSTNEQEITTADSPAYTLSSEHDKTEWFSRLLKLNDDQYAVFWQNVSRDNSQRDSELYWQTFAIDNTESSVIPASTAASSGTSEINPSFSLTSWTGIELGLTLIDAAMQNLNSQRAALGALSNRLDHIFANNTNIATNIAKSISRIEDADFAAETTNLAKQQILQQASVAMLAQANASKQNILTLLQG